MRQHYVHNQGAFALKAPWLFYGRIEVEHSLFDPLLLYTAVTASTLPFKNDYIVSKDQVKGLC